MSHFLFLQIDISQVSVIVFEMNNMISNKDYDKIYTTFVGINVVFAKMWKKDPKLIFTDEIEKAALEIIDGKFRLCFNQQFWNSLNHYNRVFIICHEYLHVIYGHWLIRADLNQEWMNIAQDIEINESLVDDFGFLHEKITGWKNHCFIETVFKEHAGLVLKDQSFEYYYELLMKCLPDESK